MEKQVGIWINTEHAVIISLEKDGHTINTINSSIEGRVRIPGEANDFARFFDQDGKKEGRVKNQTQDYFNDIVNEIKDADELVIFGPALMKKELEKYLHNGHTLTSNNSLKIHPIEPADNMTENQLVAWVKKYYKK